MYLKCIKMLKPAKCALRCYSSFSWSAKWQTICRYTAWLTVTYPTLETESSEKCSVDLGSSGPSVHRVEQSYTLWFYGSTAIKTRSNASLAQRTSLVFSFQPGLWTDSHDASEVQPLKHLPSLLHVNHWHKFC